VKIVFGSHYLLPHQGGIEVISEELGLALADRGHDVSIVVSRVPPDSAPVETCGAGGRLRKIRLPAWNFFERFVSVPLPIFFPGRLVSTLREETLGQEPVIHAHGLLQAAAAASASVGKSRSLPFIATEYVGEIPFPDPVRKAVQRWAFQFRGGAVAKRADLLVLATPRLLPQAHRWTRGLTPVVVSSAGVDARLFHPPGKGDRERIRHDWELPAHRPIVLFVGRDTPRKGLRLVESALSGLASPPLLVVAGTESPPNEDPSRRRSFGILSRARLAELYRAADLFVLPSSGEGFPVSAQEALLSSLPVVLGSDPGFLSIADPAWIEMVDLDVPSLREAISRGLAEFAERRARLTGSRPAMEKKWSVTAVAEEHERLYALARFFHDLPPHYSFARLDLSAAAKLPLLRSFFSPLPSRALDVGIGTGYGAATLFGPGYFGVDRIFENLLYARRQAGRARGHPRLVLADGSKLPFQSGVFDAVLSSEVLEHLDDDRLAASELARVLSRRGRLGVTTPHSGLGFEGFLELFGVETVHRRPGPERHVRPGYTAETMDALFTPHGLVPSRREWFLRPAGKLAADMVAGLHLAYERIVRRRREWSWSEASESEGSLAVRIYAFLFPLFRFALALDRLFPKRWAGFQIATLYVRKDEIETRETEFESK